MQHSIRYRCIDFSYLQVVIAMSMRKLDDVAQIMEPINSTVISHLYHNGTIMTSLRAMYPSKPSALTMSLTFTSDSSHT